MEVLRDAPGPLPVQDVLGEVAKRIALTPFELGRYDSGQARWAVTVRFTTGEAATLGMDDEAGGWAITEAGIEALDTYPTPDELLAELHRRYREIDQRRKQAQQNLSEVQQFIATTLRLVEPGTWTAHDDLADLAGTTRDGGCGLLASGKVRLPNAYRVLNADGSLPDEGMLNAAYRGTDLRSRLVGEGVEFDADGRAAQEQRLTADVAERVAATARAAEDAGYAGTSEASVDGARVQRRRLQPRPGMAS